MTNSHSNADVREFDEDVSFDVIFQIRESLTDDDLAGYAMCVFAPGTIDYTPERGIVVENIVDGKEAPHTGEYLRWFMYAVRGTIRDIETRFIKEYREQCDGITDRRIREFTRQVIDTHEEFVNSDAVLDYLRSDDGLAAIIAKLPALIEARNAPTKEATK